MNGQSYKNVDNEMHEGRVLNLHAISTHNISVM